MRNPFTSLFRARDKPNPHLGYDHIMLWVRRLYCTHIFYKMHK